MESPFRIHYTIQSEPVIRGILSRDALMINGRTDIMLETSLAMIKMAVLQWASIALWQRSVGIP